MLWYSVVCTVESLSLFYLIFILNLFVLGDDTLINWGSFMQTKHFVQCVSIHIRNKGEVELFVRSSVLKLSSNFLTDLCFFCVSFLLFLYCVCLCSAVLSVPYILVVTCWERAYLLALLYTMFSCVFVTFPYGVLGQV